VGLLNPGGPIAQFKRNRCSISPVELILQSGVRTYSKVDNEHFSISVEVELSNQFYSWLLQFGEKAKIMHPKEVADGMREFLEKIITMYLPRNQ